MILIADSGSTKSDWVLVENKDSWKSFSTMGFNPFFHNETIIANAIKQNKDLYRHSKNISKVFFYGAGCSSPEMKGVVKNALKRVFEQAEIFVDHDLTACAYTTYTGEPSISCILGTGSNSCYFDGENVYEEVPALAYILGDEGSGSYYGKKLLADFLYKRLPDDINKDLKAKFNLTKEEIFANVYMKPHANVYLASFMKFISNHREHEYVREMVYNGMLDFIDKHVSCYSNYKEVPVHFIGSIGFFFQDQLKEAAKDSGINLGKIIRKPIDGLVAYHLEYVTMEK